jgi:hypothetical protein
VVKQKKLVEETQRMCMLRILLVAIDGGHKKAITVSCVSCVLRTKSNLHLPNERLALFCGTFIRDVALRGKYNEALDCEQLYAVIRLY